MLKVSLKILIIIHFLFHFPLKTKTQLFQVRQTNAFISNALKTHYFIQWRIVALQALSLIRRKISAFQVSCVKVGKKEGGYRWIGTCIMSSILWNLANLFLFDNSILGVNIFVFNWRWRFHKSQWDRRRRYLGQKVEGRKLWIDARWTWNFKVRKGKKKKQWPIDLLNVLYRMYSIIFFLFSIRNISQFSSHCF